MVTICICPVQNGDYLHLFNAFVDYIPYHYQISRITVYSSRNYTAVSSTDTDKNILIDMSVQPFTGWTTSPSSISDFAGNREGLESREFVMTSSTGTRVKVSIIPSRRDKEFTFNGVTNAGPAELQTTNGLHEKLMYQSTTGLILNNMLILRLRVGVTMGLQPHHGIRDAEDGRR